MLVLLGIALVLVLAGLFAGIYGAYLRESGHGHEHHGVGSALPAMSAASTAVRVLEPSTATATADDPTEPLQPLRSHDAGAPSVPCADGAFPAPRPSIPSLPK